MSRAELVQQLQSENLALKMAADLDRRAARARHEKTPLAVDTFKDVADRFRQYGPLPCCVGCGEKCVQAGTMFGVVLECQKGRHEYSPLDTH